MKRSSPAIAIATALVLSGCAASLSGVGGSDSYACKAPQGTTCTSVSGIYANARHDASPPDTKAAPPQVHYGAVPLAHSSVTRQPGASLRSNPRVLRLWIAPWEDADGDLNEEAYVHVVVDPGRWLLEHVRPAPRPRSDAAAPPLVTAPDNARSQPSNDGASSGARFPAAPGGLPFAAEPPRRGPEP